jgi:hypothetical protein
MDDRRPRLALFVFTLALGAIGLLTYSFFSSRNGAAVVMCGICITGLIGARLMGFSNRALVPVAAGFIVLIYLVWIDPPFEDAGDHRTSALAHAVGGLLVGWAVAEYLRGRIEWPLWAIGAVAVVFALTVVWELGEYLGDRALDTALIPSKRDSARDVAFGTIGGAFGVLLVSLVPSRFWR